MFGIKDIIDILLVAFILFAIYRILRRSGASNLFWGILAFILTWLIVGFQTGLIRLLEVFKGKSKGLKMEK